MQVFKRSYVELSKNAVAAACVGLVVYVWTVSYELAEWISIVLGIVSALLVLLVFIFADNVRFELDKDGEFRCYRGSKLERTLNIHECMVMPRKKGLTSGITGNHIGMDILAPNGEIVGIDCRPLGEKQFRLLLKDLSKFAKKN